MDKEEIEEPEEWKERMRILADYENTVFLRNKIQSYIWKRWKEKLTSRGWKWQKFNRLLSFYKRDFILYLLEELNWETVIKRIKEGINGKFGKRIQEGK